jgi:hypothetical protein
VVVSGVSVWTKGEKGKARGIQGEIEVGNFQQGKFRLQDWDAVCAQEMVTKVGKHSGRRGSEGACAAERTRDRAGRRGSEGACAAERTCDRAHARPSARATAPASGGVRGVSPRQPEIQPASTTEELPR